LIVGELQKLSEHLGDQWSIRLTKTKYSRRGELELVRSTDDTMRTAYQAMRYVHSRDDVHDLYRSLFASIAWRRAIKPAGALQCAPTRPHRQIPPSTSYQAAATHRFNVSTWLKRSRRPLVKTIDMAINTAHAIKRDCRRRALDYVGSTGWDVMGSGFKVKRVCLAKRWWRTKTHKDTDNFLVTVGDA
jgi:hypothetical protein